MKKLTITTLLLAIFICSQAQEMGIKAGANVSNFKWQKDFFPQDWDPWEYSMKTGYIVGFTLTKNIGNKDFLNIPGSRIQLETGFSLSQRGAKIVTEDTLRHETSLTYLEMPCNINTTFKVGKARLFLTTGSYISIGLWGKTTDYDQQEKEVENVDWRTHQVSGGILGYDFGLIGGIGVSYKNFRLSCLYKSGLTNINNSFSRRNKALEISIGYQLINLSKSKISQNEKP